jgi:hypothetical protein
MPEQPLTYQIASVNIHKQNEQMYALLQCLPFDILLIQKPWWYNISTLHSDSDPLGSTWHGTVQRPHWTAFLPHIPDNDTVCKSVTYIWTSLLDTALPHNYLDLSPASPSYCTLSLILPFLMGPYALSMFTTASLLLDMA